MRKAVLLSVNPKWCELILEGKKTLEIRKTRPKLDTPFKVYLYCTQPKYEHEDFFVVGAGTESCKSFYGGGKVIGEFVCYNIIPIEVLPHGSIRNWMLYSLAESCVPYEEMAKYIGYDNTGYGWKISEIKIYDTPKQLNEFKRWNRTEENAPCAHVYSLYAPCDTCKECNLKRAPQSYCFVEELA